MFGKGIWTYVVVVTKGMVCLHIVNECDCLQVCGGRDSNNTPLAGREDLCIYMRLLQQ